MAILETFNLRGTNALVTGSSRGLGAGMAIALAEAGAATPLRRVGVLDVFAESGSREYLFSRYGLGTQDILDAVWKGLAINRPPPRAPAYEAAPGAYAPV